MEEKEIWYDFTAAQNVTLLQCKFTLYKRVINILSSTTSDTPLDFKILKKALDLTIERNDCLRIEFKKRNGKWQQRFLPSRPLDHVEELTFSTKEEQDAFIDRETKHAIKWKKNISFTPYFIHTYDNKDMVFLKVSHLVLDLYGLNNIYNDLFACYDALKNGTPLPVEPGSYEEVVKRDLKQQQDPSYLQSNREFFETFLKEHEMPYYTGIHGPDEPIWQKQVAKGRHSMKMFFIHCDTTSTVYPLAKATVEKAIKYSTEHKYSLANVLFYIMSITASHLNGNVKYASPIELCNCRATKQEKTSGGTKAQSLSAYTVMDYEKSFQDNMEAFSKSQAILYRHIGFPDVEFEAMRNKIYKKPMLEILYSICFSLVPFKKTPGRTFQAYSNHKGALPCYIDLMYDVDSSEIEIVFDYQTKTHTEENIRDFVAMYDKNINALLDTPNMLLKELP